MKLKKNKQIKRETNSQTQRPHRWLPHGRDVVGLEENGEGIKEEQLAVTEPSWDITQSTGNIVIIV